MHDDPRGRIDQLTAAANELNRQPRDDVRRSRHKAVVLPDHKIVYVTNLKVACSTLKWMLFDLEGRDESALLRSTKPRPTRSQTIHDHDLWGTPHDSRCVTDRATPTAAGSSSPSSETRGRGSGRHGSRSCSPETPTTCIAASPTSHGGHALRRHRPTSSTTSTGSSPPRPRKAANSTASAVTATSAPSPTCSTSRD